MDERSLERQVASVGRGITFLKQEHLAMLTGLHLEITHLKRRCHGEPPHCGAAALHSFLLHLSEPHSCFHRTELRIGVQVS